MSEEDVKKTPKHITVKTCDLDPLPTSLLAGCLEDLLTYFTSTINNSPSHGSFPNCHHETTLESQLLILKFERTIDLSPISPFFLKYWKESFSFNALIIFRQTICSSLISHLIGLVIALKQHSSKLIMTTSLLKMTINFCSCLFSICQPLFTPLIIPFFCHISTLTLVFPALFFPGSTPISLTTPKQSPSVVLNPFQLFSNLVSLRDQFLDQLSFLVPPLSLRPHPNGFPQWFLIPSNCSQI